MNKKAFTLIELIAVLVILAVISLIVTPLILNTIRRVKDAANKRSIDGYGRAVEYAMANYQLKHLTYPDSFDELEIEYSGNKVECKTSRINPDHTIYLSECKVNGKLVKNDKEFDGYYHYGILKMTNQEYVDTYGKNLEAALKAYHDEHNEYPSDYTTIILPPLDKEVGCDVSINYDGTVYLNNCKVDNEDVVDDNNEVYVYGNNTPYRPYKIGDEITYNNMNFYVIEDSDTFKESVTMLKAEALTVEEVNTYGGVGTENNHVNRYTNPSIGTARNFGGYGGVAFYSSNNCGYNETNWVQEDCTIDYEQSDLKYIVDNWANIKLGSDNMQMDSLGYKSRVITMNELMNNLGCVNYNCKNSSYNWIILSRNFWVFDSSSGGYQFECGGNINRSLVFENYVFLRPVVTLKKSVLD